MNADETTDNLIARLARGLEPVRRPPLPWRRAAAWSLGAFLYVALLVLGIAGGVGAVSGSTWLPGIAATAMAALASAAAFGSVVPGFSNPWRRWVAPAAVVWLATLMLASPEDVDWAVVSGASQEWRCVGLILIGGAPLMVVLVSMLRRGAPLAPATTSAFAALAAASLGNVVAHATLPHVNGAVTLAWHGSVAITVALSAACCGHRIFAWRHTEAVPSVGSSRISGDDAASR
jgi:hypothetical protein